MKRVFCTALFLFLGLGPADAQVSYQYTGNHFNLFCSGGGGGSCTGSPSGTSYKATDLVTATLTFDQPLGSNLNFQDVTSLPGFKLTLNDGHQTVTNTTAGVVFSVAKVSTDAGGQIIARWDLAILGNFGFLYDIIETVNIPGGPVFDEGVVHAGAPWDAALAINSPGIWAPTQGGGPGFGTATRVINVWQVSPGLAPADDIRGDVGKADTIGFYGDTSGIQVAHPKILANGLLSSGASSDSAKANGSARSVAFRQYRNDSGAALTIKVNAVLNGTFEYAWFGLPTGPLNGAGAIHVFDATMFNTKLSASGTTAGQFLLGGSPYAPQTSPAVAFQNLVSLFPGALLADGSTLFSNGPFNQQIMAPVATTFFTVAPGQNFTVMFDVATSSQVQVFGNQIGGGFVYFLDTLLPAANFFTDTNGNTVTGIVAVGDAPVLPAPPTSLVLTPATATNPAGGTHTVTATATTAAGVLVPDAIVEFKVASGPNAGSHGAGVTNTNGQASFTYSDVNGAGTDSIQAHIGALQSNVAQKTWQTAQVSCPQGQGQWKNNPAAWPAISLTLGSQTYGKADLLNLLGAPGGGDASQILAVQLIAAKLNVAAGADPAPIAATIGSADALLSGFSGKLPYFVAPNTAAGQAMTQAAGTLGSYNSGQLTRSCKQ